MKNKYIKLGMMGALAASLSACVTLGAVEESSLALQKWIGKNVTNFFYKHGKGELQGKNTYGDRAYIWKSESRSYLDDGELIVVKTEDPLDPTKTIDKVVRVNQELVTRQCVLRIETSSGKRIKSIVMQKDSRECTRYFRLPAHEREAIIAKRKAEQENK